MKYVYLITVFIVMMLSVDYSIANELRSQKAESILCSLNSVHAAADGNCADVCDHCWSCLNADNIIISHPITLPFFFMRPSTLSYDYRPLLLITNYFTFERPPAWPLRLT